MTFELIGHVASGIGHGYLIAHTERHGMVVLRPAAFVGRRAESGLSVDTALPCSAQSDYGS
jgi:hypothetical protein